MANSPKNSTFMKLQNRNEILKIIHKEPISRAELARITGLTRAAISIIVDELMDRNIIIETGTGEVDLGRKPVILDINPSSFYIIGLDISRAHYSIGLVNMKGQVVEKKRTPLQHQMNPFDTIKLVIKEISTILREKNIGEDKILGLGISAPGPLDVKNGIILNPPNFDMWKNVHVVDLLKEAFKFNIFIDNNSVALALAEKNFGIGKTLNSFILLVIDTGIGAGIVINDNLYRGREGFGGEVGHTSINMEGRTCSCGNRGCLEVYASIPAILEEASKINRDISSWNYIVDKAMDGDEQCNSILDREAKYLSSGIVNAVNILEVEAIVLTGDVIYEPGILQNKIYEYVNRTAIIRDIRKTDILITAIIEDREVVSAATIIIDKFFNGVIDPFSS